jgi:alkaline phosphatase
MARHRALAPLALLLASPTLAADPPRPQLVVTVVVDQYSTDVFAEYRSLYKEGLARLSRGVVFPRGHQSHAATETCPGHSTILTGARPARTGIIANEWQVPALRRAERGAETYTVYCVEKPGAAGSNAADRTISPELLRVPTLGDRLKTMDANARVVSVSGKDRSAVMLGGRMADLTLWWTERGFVTYADRQASIPTRIQSQVNGRVRNSYAQATTVELPPQCTAKSRPVDVVPGITVGVLQATPANSRRWRATPAFDALTVDAALVAVEELQLGKRGSTDLLAVSLAGTDYVGHYFGTAGAEMCAQQLALDRIIGRLLAALDKARITYVVALTADHGALDVTERNQMRGVPAQRVAADLTPQTVGAALASELGLTGTVILGPEFTSDVYFSAAIPGAKRPALLQAALRKYRSHPQVEIVFTKSELLAAPAPGGAVDEWTLLERAKASFDPERSGDLVVLLKPYITLFDKPKNLERDYVASHGTPWGYDRRVPILFWWNGITGFEQPAAVETVDIMPTLAGLIGLPIAADEIDGRQLPLMR